MIKTIWYEKAQTDIEEIYDYYFTISPQLAVKMYNSIVKETERLSFQPYMAPREPLLASKEFKYTFRSLATKDKLFKIVYFVDNNSIVIVRIWSCRKDTSTFSVI